MHAQGASFWPLAMCRELDDLILWLRTNEPELGTWVFTTSGDIGTTLGYERLIEETTARTGWPVKSGTS